uniref:Uncharacterized protein n=1 Tax=Heterorhabditis bacteriophora TaxID=37862 RepID=A0A1I7WHC6_HETBA
MFKTTKGISTRTVGENSFKYCRICSFWWLIDFCDHLRLIPFSPLL